MKKHLHYITFALILCKGLWAQDLILSDPIQSPLYLNPSYAGSNGMLRTQAIYLVQSPQLTSRQDLIAVAADGFIKPLKAGLALNYVHKEELFDVIMSDHISLTYAQYFSLLGGKLQVIPSFQTTFAYQRFDFRNVPFNSDFWSYYDPNRIAWQHVYEWPIERVYYEFSSGLLANYKNLAFGTAIYHLNRPNVAMISGYRLPCRFNSHINYTFKWSEKTQLSVLLNHNYQEIFGHRIQGMLNALVLKRLMLGGGYDSFNYFVGNIGYRGNFLSATISYSDDLGLNDQIPIESFQLVLGYSIRPAEQRKSTVSFQNW